jgi:hypothetical protein
VRSRAVQTAARRRRVPFFFMGVPECRMGSDGAEEKEMGYEMR